MIAIISYGLGNVKAFAEVYKKLDIAAVIASREEDLQRASKLILPGVGAFDTAMRLLDQSGLHPLLDDMVQNQKIPVLGICVGMQMLADSSEEGTLPGLGWIAGKVKKFNFSSSNDSMRLPHMGWNNIKALNSNFLLQKLDQDTRFYFLHSYFFQAHSDTDVIAVTDYNGKFACAINYENIYGVQFHPEKSHQWGVQLLENFARL